MARRAIAPVAAAVLLAPLAAVAADPSGAAVFAAHCAVCHGAKAEGVPSTFPPLGAQVTAFAKVPEGREYLVTVVSAGLIGSLAVAGGHYQGAMPAQGLSAAEAAAVLNHVAAGLGKGKPPAKPFDATEVEAIRGRHAGAGGAATMTLRPAPAGE